MKTYVVIPTFNEIENIGRLIKEILALEIKDLYIIVVDDDSPDGTGKLVKELFKNDPRVQLIVRTNQRGRGEAGVAGFRYVLAKGADYIIEMDADFSHRPEYIPKFLTAIKKHDVVVGSRFVKGGQDRDRGLLRRLITKLAGVYIRIVLGLKIRDVSSGFRCFKREALEKVDLGGMISTGPSIVLEILYRIILNGSRVQEIPIVFRDRRQGKTKLHYVTLFETFLMVLRLRKMRKKANLI